MPIYAFYNRSSSVKGDQPTPRVTNSKTAAASPKDIALDNSDLQESLLNENGKHKTNKSPNESKSMQSKSALSIGAKSSSLMNNSGITSVVSNSNFLVKKVPVSSQQYQPLIGRTGEAQKLPSKVPTNKLSGEKAKFFRQRVKHQSKDADLSYDLMSDPNAKSSGQSFSSKQNSVVHSVTAKKIKDSSSPVDRNASKKATVGKKRSFSEVGKISSSQSKSSQKMKEPSKTKKDKTLLSKSLKLKMPSINRGMENSCSSSSDESTEATSRCSKVKKSKRSFDSWTSRANEKEGTSSKEQFGLFPSKEEAFAFPRCKQVDTSLSKGNNSGQSNKEASVDAVDGGTGSPTLSLGGSSCSGSGSPLEEGCSSSTTSSGAIVTSGKLRSLFDGLSHLYMTSDGRSCKRPSLKGRSRNQSVDVSTSGWSENTASGSARSHSLDHGKSSQASSSWKTSTRTFPCVGEVSAPLVRKEECGTMEESNNVSDKPAWWYSQQDNVPSSPVPNEDLDAVVGEELVDDKSSLQSLIAQESLHHCRHHHHHRCHHRRSHLHTSDGSSNYPGNDIPLHHQLKEEKDNGHSCEHHHHHHHKHYHKHHRHHHHHHRTHSDCRGKHPVTCCSLSL